METARAEAKKLSAELEKTRSDLDNERAQARDLRAKLASATGRSERASPSLSPRGSPRTDGPGSSMNASSRKSTNKRLPVPPLQMGGSPAGRNRNSGMTSEEIRLQR